MTREQPSKTMRPASLNGAGEAEGAGASDEGADEVA